MDKEKLIDFASVMLPAYEWNWHHKFIASRLDAFRRGEIKRLILCMPPQHSKSTLTTMLFPAQCVGLDPDLKIVIGSYGSTLSQGFNKSIQRYIDTSEYSRLFPFTILPGERDSKYVRNAEKMELVDYLGYIMTVSIGGGLTGNRADMLIVDDPHKDFYDAANPLQSEKVYEWFTSVAKARTNNDSGILVVQTRWHTNDLVGRILKREAEAIKNNDPDADRWEVICLPAIKENDGNLYDPRSIGEALWPAMHSLRKLNDARGDSPRRFAAMYQQNPQPIQAGGEAYKSFDYNRNTGTHHYNPYLPLHLSFDFNVNPYMTCLIFQIQTLFPLSEHLPEHGIVSEVELPAEGLEATQLLPFYQGKVAKPEGSTALIPGLTTHDSRLTTILLEEICLRSPRNTTAAVCEYIIEKYSSIHQSTMYIYGDPSGRRQDTRLEQGRNDYTIIEHHLAGFRPQLRLLSKAPSVYMRIMFMNSLFVANVKGLSISIDRSATHTIDDFMYIKEESDGTKQRLKESDPVTGVVSEKFSHCSDAAEYFICSAFYKIYMQHIQNFGAPITVDNPYDAINNANSRMQRNQYYY